MDIKKDYQVWCISFFDKKIGSRLAANVSLVLAKELHKQVTKKFKNRKVCAWFKDNI